MSLMKAMTCLNFETTLVILLYNLIQREQTHSDKLDKPFHSSVILNQRNETGQG
jgi:hypothetical protein